MWINCKGSIEIETEAGCHIKAKIPKLDHCALMMWEAYELLQKKFAKQQTNNDYYAEYQRAEALLEAKIKTLEAQLDALKEQCKGQRLILTQLGHEVGEMRIIEMLQKGDSK